jgi:hypothetical protein
MKSRLIFLGFAVAVAGLVITNIVLQRHNQDLRAALSNLEDAKGPPVGSQMTWIPGLDLNDQPILIDNAGRDAPRRILVFSTACDFTPKNWPYWRRLLAASPAENVIFVSTTGDVTAAYLKAHSANPQSLVLKIDGLARLQYDLRVTPTTVLLSPDGKVAGVWVGVLNEKRLTQISRQMSILNQRGQEEDTE